MLLKHNPSPAWSWELENSERCSFVRLFHTGFPKFSGLFPLGPPLCKKESQTMLTKCQDSPSVSQGQTDSLEVPAPPHWVWGRPKLAAAVWNGPHLYDGMPVTLLGHKHGAKALFGCKSLSQELVFGGGWGCNSGFCLFSDRTESQHVLVVLCSLFCPCLLG